MKIWRIAATAAGLVLSSSLAGAELGWPESRYIEAYGQGQKSYGKANERGYSVGQSRLLVELSPDNSHSVAELWFFGLTRDGIPEQVLQASSVATGSEEVERVTFRARSAIPAEIREAVVDDIVVRVDVRNQATVRVALCGKLPQCSWWQRLVGACDAPPKGCPVLDRALSVDRTMDEMHRRAEDAVERMGH